MGFDQTGVSLKVVGWEKRGKDLKRKYPEA